MKRRQTTKYSEIVALEQLNEAPVVDYLASGLAEVRCSARSYVSFGCV